MRTRAFWLFPAVGILLGSSPLHAVPVHQWSGGFGDQGSQFANGVATDGVGNVVITGSFTGTVDFGGGPLTSSAPDGSDIFVAKFDMNGNHLWSQRFGGTDNQSGNSVAVDGSGNVVLTGAFWESVNFGGGSLVAVDIDVFLVKFDAGGNHLWSKDFGDGDDQVGFSVAVDASSNVLITGRFAGTVNFGGGPLTSAGSTDIFVAKFDADGNHVWSRRFGDGDVYDQVARSVAADGSGDVVITGTFGGTVDFGGGPLISTGSDIFVAKFDADGNHLWSERYGDGDVYGQVGNSVTTDGSGSIVVTGSFGGTVDFGGGTLTSTGSDDIFVAKFDTDGNHLWSERYGDGDVNDQVGNSVTTDGSGSIVVTGSFGGTVDFGGGTLTSTGSDDIFVAKFDTDGNHLWSERYGDGDVNDQVGSSVAADGSGNIVVTGWFGGTVDFGGGTLTGAGGQDVFLAKFTETPLPVLITRFEAKTRGITVEVTWDVWSDEALESFALYRSDDVRAQPIVIAEGAFNQTTRSYVDASVEPGTTYQYELLIHTQDGDDFRSPVATATVPALTATIGQNFPNPFNPSTTIEYTLSERSESVLGIYDAAGRLIVRLDQGVRDSGTHRAVWDGRDASGKAVGSGVYFYRIEGAPRVAPKKMVLVR